MVPLVLTEENVKAHWKRYRPEVYKGLLVKGLLNQSVSQAVDQTNEALVNALHRGMDPYQAWEAVRGLWAFPPSEPREERRPAESRENRSPWNSLPENPSFRPGPMMPSSTPLPPPAAPTSPSPTPMGLEAGLPKPSSPTTSLPYAS